MGKTSVPTKNLCPDIGSMSEDSSDSECETLLNLVMNSQPSTSTDSGGQQKKDSPNIDDDADLRELTKEHESGDSVGAALKSEQLAKLLNKMFRSKMGETILKEKLERQVRPENCAYAKVTRCNTGIWRKLRENMSKLDLQMAKMQQPLVKGIIPIAQVADTAMGAKSLNLDEIQLVKKRCLEALSLLTHVNYELIIQRRFLMKPDIGSEFGSLCSPVVPFTDNLFGDDLQKHLKDIGDQNKIGAKLQRGTKANYSPASGTSFGRASHNQNRPKNQHSRGPQYPGKKYPHKGNQFRAPNKDS